MAKNQRGKVLIPGGVRPWPHELRIANVLALAGHAVEFLPKTNMKTADILLDDVALMKLSLQSLLILIRSSIS